MQQMQGAEGPQGLAGLSSIIRRELVAVQWLGGKARTCEDLKERYYKVARSLQVAWEGSEEGAANLTLVKHPFNAQHERCAVAPMLHCSCLQIPRPSAPVGYGTLLYKLMCFVGMGLNACCLYI